MGRKLEKNEFLSLLKEVSDKLDKRNIQNEIPFVYKDKQIYDSIKILIPQNTDITLLEDIFKTGDYNLQGKFIDFNYKDFRFIFIRTPDNEFLQTFFYYSWDIVPTLLNVMLNKMGLDLQPNGLRYIAVENPIFISNNIKFVLEYLGLDSYIFLEGKKGFKTLFEEASYVSTSEYFNPIIFKECVLNENDYFYFEKKPQYDYILTLFDNFNNIQFEGYNFNKELDTYFLNIELMFPGSKFLENIAKVKFKK